MFKASLELNKALKGFLDISESLGEVKDPKACDIGGEAKLKACTRFMKIYELCVRVDESLKDILRHRGTGEAKPGFNRTTELLQELTDIVGTMKEKEKRMFLTYIRGEFFEYRKHLQDLMKKRPAARIWDGEELNHVAGDLSTAVGALRKSAAFVLLMITSPGEEEAAGKLLC